MAWRRFVVSKSRDGVRFSERERVLCVLISPLVCQKEGRSSERASVEQETLLDGLCSFEVSA